MARWAAELGIGLVIGAGCGEVSSKAPDAAIGDATVDVLDAPPGACNPTGGFDAPVALSGLATNGRKESAQLSPDELTIYFSGYLGTQHADIYVATRNSLGAGFGMPVALAGGVRTDAEDWDPTVTADGLTIFFGSTRAAGEGNHIYVATRSTIVADFGTAAKVGNVGSSNLPDNDGQPFLTADGQELWFISNRSGGLGGQDIYRATKNGAGFGTPTAVAELNSSVDEWLPVLSADKLTVYFASARTGAQGFDIWLARRTTTNDGFSAPTLVPGINSPQGDYPSWISPDNCRLYFWSSRTGTDDIYIATRQPS